MVIEGTHLGKKSSYPQHYDPSVLVAVPRILNREQYGISNEQLPFRGFDVWHAYEFSFLLNNGVPVAGMLKIVYPCNNEFLVESKSLKLYLNSFNMDQFGTSVSKGISETTATIKTDLQELLKCAVEVTFFSHTEKSTVVAFDDYSILEDSIDSSKLICTAYSESPDLLEKSDHRGEIKWGSHLLRSNCKITFQPDWGSIFLHMKGNDLPTPESVLRYLVSLRNENHFHEEICEMVFKRLADRYNPDELTVTCQYTRRGGIDINPVRSLTGTDLPASLIDSRMKDAPVFRQ